MPDWISHEPVVWTVAVGALLNLAILFGLPMTPEQKTGVSLAVDALLGLFLRSQVTPQAKIEAVPLAARALKDAGHG